MEQKQRLFIYDRKELGVLMLLGILVAVFAFTLGVHLGKVVAPKATVVLNPTDTSAVSTLPDQSPSRQEANDQAKGVPQAVEESLHQAVHDEVARTGLKLTTPRQVDLPNQAKTGGKEGSTATALPVGAEKKLPALARPLPVGAFTVQVGSHDSLDDAKNQVDALEALNKKPFVRVAEVKGKGRWFRVYLGGYLTRDEAEVAGDKLKAQHLFESYIVSKMPD